MSYTQEERAFFAKHRRLPVAGERVDSVQDGGLIMTERVNDAGGKIRTFSYESDDIFHPKTWMDAHRAPLQLQLGINKSGTDKRVFESRCKARYAEQQQVEQVIAQRGVQALPLPSIAHELAAAGDGAFVLYGGK